MICRIFILLFTLSESRNITWKLKIIVKWDDLFDEKVSNRAMKTFIRAVDILNVELETELVPDHFSLNVLIRASLENHSALLNLLFFFVSVVIFSPWDGMKLISIPICPLDLATQRLWESQRSLNIKNETWDTRKLIYCRRHFMKIFITKQKNYIFSNISSFNCSCCWNVNYNFIKWILLVIIGDSFFSSRKLLIYFCKSHTCCSVHRQINFVRAISLESPLSII